MSKIIKANNLIFIQAPVKEEYSSEEANSINHMETFYQEAKLIAEELITQAKARAEKFLQEANDEVKELLANAQKQAEIIKEQAYREGFESGKEEGLKEAEILKQQANEIIKKAYEERKKILENMESEIVDFSIKIAEKIIRQQIDSNQEIACSIVQDLLAHVQDSTQVTVKVSARDYEYLINQVAMLQSFLNYGTLNLELDDTLNPGDCIVVSENGIVVAKVDEQFDKLQRILREGTYSD
ncbi:MAG: hypothetical protein GXW85_06240 [Clostridia bacterium]|nr:hypothetical protein [Clostridia bacterium]